MVVCSREIWEGIHQEVVTELGPEAFDRCFSCFFFFKLKTASIYFQNLFLLVKLKNVFGHLNQNSYLKKKSDKIF